MRRVDQDVNDQISGPHLIAQHLVQIEVPLSGALGRQQQLAGNVIRKPRLLLFPDLLREEHRSAVDGPIVRGGVLAELEGPAFDQVCIGVLV